MSSERKLDLDLDFWTGFDFDSLRQLCKKLCEAPDPKYILAEQSRYKKDFKQIKLIGVGGYGAVFECKNKCDEASYAIKKVPFHDDYRKSYWREVCIMAGFKHNNIIRYYQAWEEKLDATDTIYKILRYAPIFTDLNQLEGYVTQMGEEPEKLEKHFTDSEEEPEGLEIKHFTDSEEEAEELEEHLTDSEEEPEGLEEHLTDSEEEPEGLEEHLTDSEEEPEVSKPFCLLIVMELCKSSLYGMVMDEKKPIDTEKAWMLFRQIVDGLHYIHSHQVIHRDLSIQNILVDDSETIKIIDFGLAKQWVENEELLNSDGNRGNKMFRAPEMRSKGSIDEKVDIYSLGVILVRLLYPCNTGMGIKKVFSDLEEKDELPDDWNDRGGKSLILKLLSKEPRERPSTADILALLNMNSKPE